jgi:hypothetical protein
LKAQGLGSGGAISVRLRERLDNQLPSESFNVLAVQ